MASSLALKKLVSSNLLSYSLRATSRAIPSIQSASRLFNTNAVAFRGFSNFVCRSVRKDYRPHYGFDCTDYGSRYDYDILPEEPLSGVLNSEETEDTLYLRVDMPGVEKEDVKVIVKHKTMLVDDEIVEHITVIFKGETKEKSGEKDSDRRYKNQIDLPSKLYKTKQIKAEMKNGVLKVVVPKEKEEEQSDLFHVKVE